MLTNCTAPLDAVWAVTPIRTKRARTDAIDPNVWSGRALQGSSSSCLIAVLHQCIRPLLGACCTPGHHGYQRACVLISGQASTGPFGSPVFASAGKTDPPSRFIPSQTSAGNAYRFGYVIANSSFWAAAMFFDVE